MGEFSANSSSLWQDLNHCYRFGSMESMPLKMFILDPTHPERFGVGMSPKHIFMQFWVLETDYTSYSVIGSENRKSLWWYGRTVDSISQSKQLELSNKYSALGFNVGKMKKIKFDSQKCKY